MLPFNFAQSTHFESKMTIESSLLNVAPSLLTATLKPWAIWLSMSSSADLVFLPVASGQNTCRKESNVAVTNTGSFLVTLPLASTLL